MGFTVEYKANKIFGNIYQGPFPPVGKSLANSGIHTVVLCAKEFQDQYDESSLPGVNIIRAPSIDSDDGPPLPEWVERWTAAAKRVAEISKAGNRVLVTCHAGLNRSGVVSALAVHYLTGFEGSRCAKIVQLSRPGALSNSRFVEFLNKIPPVQNRNG